MSNLLPILAALAIGLGAAVQTSMLGALGRARGPAEASWLSILATATAIAAILAYRLARGETLALPAPFDRAAILAGAALTAALALLLTTRGLPPYFAITGLFGLAFIFGAATIVPRIGIALFLSATIAGQLLGALALDQIGAFGGAVQPLSAMRVGGAAFLLLGVAMVRGLGR